MRAELINLPFTTESSRRLDPPLYLLQLAPVLQDEGFSVRINDLNGLYQDQWGFGHCLMYVIYSDTKGYELASEIARYCKHTNERAIIVACGSGPSKMTNRYVKNKDFTVVIKGESEIALVKFIRDSIVLMMDDVSKVYRMEVNNINKLPFPNRALIEMNTYARKLDGVRATMVMGSRGSPFGSTWICNKLKYFSIKRIANEVDQITQIYGIRNFFFGDVCFTHNEQRALDIAKSMKQKGLHFGFNDVINNINIDLLKELEQLGAKEVLVNPIGSNNDDQVKHIQNEIVRVTGMKAIVRKDSKYAERKEGIPVASEEENNGKQPRNQEETNSML